VSVGSGKVQMQVDQSYCNILIGQNGALPANQFTWVDYGASTTSKINVSLAAGTHNVIVAGVDPGVGVDKVMFLTDTTCIPTGFGTNCGPAPTATPVPGGGTTPTPSVTPISSPTATATPKPTANTAPVVIKPGNSTTPVVVSGKITLTPLLPTTDKVAYMIDGQPVGSDNLDTTKLSDGEHVVEQVTTDSHGQPTLAKQTIKVENGWQYQLVRGVQGHWQIISGIVLLLILVGGGILYAMTHRALRSTVGSSGPSEAELILPTDPPESSGDTPPNNV